MSGFLEAQGPSSVSHWIASNRGPGSLHNHGKEDSLPETADIVIVGAGISGALLAYYLANPEERYGDVPKGRTIVVLEGAEVASGATGRNGGHFAPATFMSYPNLIRSRADGGAGVSKREAVRILRNEWDNYERNTAVIKLHNLQDKVELWQGRVMTVYGSEDELRDALETHRQWEEALAEEGLSDWSGNKFYTDTHEVLKFTTELLKLAIASERDHISLFTGTPVIDVSETQASSGQDVRTNRGTIRAKQIILCTNAHTPHLFPEDHPLKTFIFPSRQQMGLVTPTTSFAGTRALQTTYGFPKGYCATTSGGIVVGLGERVYVSEGCGSAEDFIGNSDDTTVLPGCTEYLESFMASTMIGWGEQALGEGLTRTWTGVKGHTIDRLPLVGPVPDRKGLFLSAGFNGHGMSTTHTCARALTQLVLNGTWDQDFPEAYILSPPRLERQLPEGGYVRLITGAHEPAA
ncbi:hypothetical protein EHS25_005880 [Saitozyma podzolica]|uniref:FAD dependent oxidoreductase domain-containing protein n=1 Tax=Saitozyma podzolica TaxID=1890683 RepID=A0A427XVN2_9TREE|nr:hypothetical protein EHS25_005880 [Saitozyma podzolica]